MQPQPHQVHIVGPGNWTSQQVPAGHIVQGAPRPSFQGAPVVLHPRPSYAGAPPPTRGSFMQPVPVGHPQQAPPPPHQQPQPQQGAGAPVPPQQRGAVAGGPPPPTTGPPIRSGPPAELRRSLSKLPPFPVCPTGQWRTMHMENEQRMVELESRSSGRRSRRRGRQGQLVEEETIYMNQSNRIVVRVRDRLTGKTFVLKKVVTPCEAHLTPEECLEQGSKDLHEVRVMVNMDHPNVVKVYEAWLDVERPERRSAWFLQWLAIQAEAGVRGYVHAATSMMRGQGHPHQLPQGGDANKGKPKGQAPDMYKLHYTVLYILMEDCKGGSLEDLLKQSPEGLHSEGVLHKLLVQSASAFAFLALNDMVHKDVKTLNVFLDSQINVRVGDFGSAVTMISGRTEAMGEMTELFIAPEFFRGEQHLNEKFDVFALGLVFLRLVCGSALQVGVPQGVLGFGRAIAMNPQIRIEEMDEYLSSGTPLARIILHMLDPNPATRWSAEQVFDHLVLYQPQTLLTPHRGPPVQSNSRSAGIHDVLLPPPDAVRDYNSCYRLYEDVDDQPGMSMWRRMCSWRSMMWTLLGWIMFGALIFLLAFVTRDRIEEGFDREDVGYDVDQTSLIMGATFIASLGAAVLFTFLLRIFHFAPSLIYYGIYLITLLAGVYCANVFRENDNGVFAVAAISYAAVKLWFVLVRNVQRNFNLQRPIVLYVTRYLMFSHMGKARRLFVLSLLVAVLQFAVLGFGALFFLENPTDVARIASLLPFLWLLSIMRNVLHYVAAFVFHNQVTPHQSKFRHPVQIGLTHALTLHFAPIIVASVFTTLQPFFSTFLRVADALFIMGQYAGCYWRYQVDDDRDHPWSDSEHDQPQSVPLAEAPKGDEQNGGNHLAPPKKGDPVGSSPPRSPSPGHSPAPPKDAPAEAMTVPVGSIFQPSANPFDPDPQRHAPPRGVSDPGNASSAPSGGGGGAHHKQRQGVYKSQTGSQASELCCINWLCTGPALALQFIGRPAKLGYKLIVTIMGYYGLGFKPSLRWMRKRAGVLHLQGDEVLDNYFSNVAVLAGFAAVIVADLYEEQVAAFAFLVAYATFRVAVEPAVATITAAWISSLSGETKEEVFDRILVETNQAIEREMLLLSRRSHDRHAGRITRM